MSGLLPVLCLAETAYDLNAKGGRAMEQGRSEEAVSYFKEALRLAPENKVIRANLSVSYNNLALDYDAGGDFDRANLMMEKAFAADPDSALIKKNYGMLLTNQAWRRFDGKRDESEILPLLEKALGYTTALPQAYILLGEIYFKRDEQKRAAENWDKALSLDPSLKEVKKKLKKLSKEIKTEKEFSSHSGEHFKVKFEGIELWSDAWTVLEILESVYYRLGGIFNLFPDRPITVIIYTQEQFRDISGTPDWIAGVYDGKIRIGKGLLAGDRETLKRVLYHEYTHAFIHSYIGTEIPVWLNEGIAQYFEDPERRGSLRDHEREFVKERLAVLPFLDVEKINEMFNSASAEEESRFAYFFAKSFVALLVRKEGEYSLRRVLDELKRGSGIEDISMKIYYNSLRGLLSEWRNSLG